MLKQAYYALLIFILAMVFIQPTTTEAAPKRQGVTNVKKAEKYINQALKDAKKGNLNAAKQSYQIYRNTWLKIEGSVKSESSEAYTAIESQMGKVSFTLIQNKPHAVVGALQGLKKTDKKFINGKFKQGNQLKKNKGFSLTGFIGLLQKTKAAAQNHNQQAALKDIANVRKSWLSVEGRVVSWSKSVYDQSETDMVTVQAMLSSNPPKYQQATRLLGKMISYLGPITKVTGYTIWDAAIIPIREGLEAILVVVALLAFVKKSGNQTETRKGKGWVGLGVTAGLLFSVLLAVIVKFVFSSGTFGHNNFLITGWTGVFAAVMLLYMSYWLHRQSSIKDWNQYIRSKSRTALSNGRLASLGVLAFLAIFREGTETVLFIIGMVNQISLQNLLTGLLIGVGILVVLAYLMIFAGLKLPLRPFFLVSSLIIFYLCVKYLGMGIHSLQLANVLPATSSSALPTIHFVAVYPSWQSFLPQLAVVLFGIGVVVWKKITVKRNPLAAESQESGTAEGK